MSTVSNTSNVRTASVQTASAPSASEAKSIWQNEVNKDAAERAKLDTGAMGYLNADRTEAYKSKVTEDMNKFIQEHPNASADDIKAAAQESIKKHTTHEILGKMEFEYFLKKMTARSQELSQDMWK